MKRRNLVPAFVLPTVLAAATLSAQTLPGTQEDMKPQSPEQDVQADANALPRTIFPGPRKAVAGHVQGMAVDLERRHVYFSYTTELVKTDFEGKVLGSVKGLTGHLGCISYNPEDGKVYGSLEFKNDAIGRSIRKSIAEAQNGAADGDAPVAVGFYVAAFDGQNITRPDMDAEDASVLKTVFLREVCDDHTATVVNNGRQVEHRFGCSGIDGTTLAPGFGADRGRTFVYVAYGVYKDATRTDNDYQVILAYDLETLAPYWSRHTREGLHRNGPEKPDAKYFVYTGNTSYGVQNLAYDPHSGNFFMAAYKGNKQQFPQYTLFVVDGSRPPRREPLKGFDGETYGDVLSLLEKGNVSHGIYGWDFPFGPWGMAPVGGGLFYLVDPWATVDGRKGCAANLYRFTGAADAAFEPVK